MYQCIDMIDTIHIWSNKNRNCSSKRCSSKFQFPWQKIVPREDTDRSLALRKRKQCFHNVRFAMLSLSFHPALTTSEAESAGRKHVEKYVENKLVEKARCFWLFLSWSYRAIMSIVSGVCTWVTLLYVYLTGWIPLPTGPIVSSRLNERVPTTVRPRLAFSPIFADFSHTFFLLRTRLVQRREKRMRISLFADLPVQLSLSSIK